MAASTNNYTLNPGGAWVQVVTGPVTNYFMLRHFPKHVPVYYAVGTTTPAANAGGLRDDCGEFWSQGALASGTNIYARISNNANNVVQVSVYQN